MKIITLKEVDSTHTYLKNHIKQKGFTAPICISTQNQTSGVGSRGNSWSGVKGNLFFSFSLCKSDLPSDLLLQSASIYFSFILKKILKEKGSNIWLKWPNDFYIGSKKIGGTITTVNRDIVMCGIGINIKKVEDEFGVLDIDIDINQLLKEYFIKIEKKILWCDIFSEFMIEFKLSRKFCATVENKKVSLVHAVLNCDGSIEINKEKVYSLR